MWKLKWLSLENSHSLTDNSSILHYFKGLNWSNYVYFYIYGIHVAISAKSTVTWVTYVTYIQTSAHQKASEIKENHIITQPTLFDWQAISGKCYANTQKCMISGCQTEQTHQINKNEKLKDYCFWGGGYTNKTFNLLEPSVNKSSHRS